MKDKDGKEEKKDLNICLTHHERLDGNTGMVLVSAALRQVEGQDKQHFMVMVPLGMMIQPGMRATLYPKDAWEKVQKGEKVDETKLKAMKLAYTLCHPAGCTAEMEATQELLAELRAGGGLVVFAINAGGAPVGFPVPLVGFDQSSPGARRQQAVWRGAQGADAADRGAPAAADRAAEEAQKDAKERLPLLRHPPRRRGRGQPTCKTTRGRGGRRNTGRPLCVHGGRCRKGAQCGCCRNSAR